MRHDASDPLRRLLSDGEELVWHARPHRRSLVVQYLAHGVPVLVFFGPFVFFALLFVVFAAAAAVESLAVLAVGGLLAAGATVLAVYGLVYLVAKRAHAHAEYAATDDRLIEFGGVLGRDYSSVRWNAVQELEVDVGWLDGRYDTGTVEAVADGGSDSGVRFDYVEAPYAVVERLEAVARGRDG